jgi:hypothetical protein
MPEIDIEEMALPVENARFGYIIAYPNGKRFRKSAKFIGIVSDARWLRDTILHGKPLGTKIESIAMLGENGKQLPTEYQPELFQSAWKGSADKETLEKLQDVGWVNHPGAMAPPRGFAFITEDGEELEPVNGSDAAKAAEQNKRLLGLGYHFEKAVRREIVVPLSSTKPLDNPSKAGAAIAEHAKRAADAGLEDLPEETNELPTTAEAKAARQKAQQERKSAK